MLNIWKYNGNTNWSQQVIFKKDTNLGDREIGCIREKVEKGVTGKCDQNTLYDVCKELIKNIKKKLSHTFLLPQVLIKSNKGLGFVLFLFSHQEHANKVKQLI